MRKIFYNPQTLEIRAMSDGDDPVSLPYIEVEENYHSFQYLSLEKKGKKIKVINNEPVVDYEQVRKDKQAKKELKKSRSQEHRERIMRKEEKQKELAHE